MIDWVAIIAFISSFFIALFLGYLILAMFKMGNVFYGKCMLFCLFGHYIGGICFFWYTLYYTSDVWGYFWGGAPVWHALGFNTIAFIVWYLRHWFFGDSYLATYTFFIDIGFLGSMLYFVCYHKLYLRIINNYVVSINFKKLKWGYLLVACWPSSLFWTSCMGKDPLVFLGISLFFVSLIQMRQNKMCLFTMLIGGALAFIVRPYLLFVGIVGFFLWQVFAKKRSSNVFVNLLLVVIVTTVFVVLSKTGMVNKLLFLSDYSLTGIAAKGVAQQKWLVGGSSVPVPTHNPALLPLFLPYLMFVNLFLPLFFAIRNFLGVIASFQNVLLLILCYKFIKSWKIWRYIQSIPVLGYMFWFFIVGIALLGLINTNMGLADREKLMYLPPFLIVLFLTLAIKSIKRESS